MPTPRRAFAQYTVYCSIQQQTTRSYRSKHHCLHLDSHAFHGAKKQGRERSTLCMRDQMLLIRLGSAQLRQALAVCCSRCQLCAARPWARITACYQEKMPQAQNEENRSCGNGLSGSSLNVVLGRLRLGSTAVIVLNNISTVPHGLELWHVLSARG